MGRIRLSGSDMVAEWWVMSRTIGYVYFMILYNSLNLIITIYLCLQNLNKFHLCFMPMHLSSKVCSRITVNFGVELLTG